MNKNKKHIIVAGLIIILTLLILSRLGVFSGLDNQIVTHESEQVSIGRTETSADSIAPEIEKKNAVITQITPKNKTIKEVIVPQAEAKVVQIAPQAETKVVQIAPQAETESKPTTLKLKRDSVKYWLSKVSIKANMLYYAALAPNFGVEYKFSDEWSFSASVTIPWWSNDQKEQRYRLQLYEIENRRYFGQGNRHHLGLYFQAGTYDLKFSAIGAIGDFGVVGLSYGYKLPIKKRFHLDFEVGFGYLISEYERYEVIRNDYVYINTRKTKLFAPTKIGVSLVWELGNKYRLRPKGKSEGGLR